MTKRTDRDEFLHRINQYWNPGSSRCGRLIHRFDGLWHYGVAISEETAVSWGPVHPAPLADGQLVVHPIGPEFSDAVAVAYLPLNKIRLNLMASVSAFHGTWRYGIQGWNCEHWARLVVSGHATSHQVAKTGWGLFDIFGILRRHHGAEHHLTKEIKRLGLIDAP